MLSDVSLRSGARRLGVVGRNGSGKSSLARLLTGLAKPDRGDIRLFGANVAEDRAAALRHVGMIFQNPDQQIIFPTVVEELSFGLKNIGLSDGESNQRVNEILTRFGWQGWDDKPVYTLSHGQKHLLCLMAVLLMEPQLIVFDEPYAGLDIPTARHMNQLIRDLPQHLVVVSHRPEDLEEFDELLWLENGRMQDHGPVKVIMPKYLAAMSDNAAMDSRC